MIALICLLVPGAVMVLVKEKMFNIHENLYKNILTYLFNVLILNVIMMLILYYIFDNYGQMFSKLNQYLNFACKYFALAMMMALVEPFAERLLKNCAVKMVPVIQQLYRDRNIVWKAVFSLIIVIVYLIIGSCKNGYHVDEMYTLGLSNHQYNGISPEISEGVVYTGQQLWQEYTMVSEDNRFDYGNVIENQTHDVHPPLYYAVIHTVFSLFPNTYSIYFPLIVNEYCICSNCFLANGMAIPFFYKKAETLGLFFTVVYIYNGFCKQCSIFSNVCITDCMDKCLDYIVLQI